MTEPDDNGPRATASEDERYRAPALDKGLDILEVLAREMRALTRTEIAHEIDWSPSQIYRVLERLVARGYASRIGGDRYTLSMKMFLLSTDHPPLRRLTMQIQPELDAFTAAMRQSVHLVVEERGRALVIAQASPAENWEFRARIGGRLGMLTSGSGLTLLAFRDPEQNAASVTAGDLARLEAEFDKVRRAGYRMAPSHQLVGVTDITVPVLGPSGHAYAVLTCAFIEHPNDDRSDMRAEVVRQLQQIAASTNITPLA